MCKGKMQYTVLKCCSAFRRGCKQGKSEILNVRDSSWLDVSIGKQSVKYN
jgi:hypothetical protein